MNNIFTILFFLVFHSLYSQHNFELYNNGTILHVQAGANMYVLGDFHMAGGALSRLENNGFIEVEGNMYGNNLFQQRGIGSLRLSNRLVNIGQVQTIYGTNSYAVRGGQATIGVNDGSFYNLELANDVGTIYLSGGGNVCDVRNAVNFRPTVAMPYNRIITAEPPPTALPTNGSLYPSIFGIMNTNTVLATVMPNNTISTNGNMSPIDVGYIQGKLRRAINPAGGNYHFVLGLEPAGTTAQRGVQLIRADFAANDYDVVTSYFETGSDNTISGTPVECSGYAIDYFGGVDHGEWVFNQSGGNSGLYSMNVWPQDHNFPSKTVWLITKDDTISGTANQCGVTPVALARGGFNGFSEFGLAGANILLPIELLEFNAYPVNNEFIQLKWVTASEKNTSHFIVEKSIDGIHFKPIGQVAASGNSNQIRDYFFDDRNIEPNIIYYYRFKSVDVDASFTLSPIRQAKISSDVESPFVIINSNPVTNQNFQIDFFNYSGLVALKIYNLIGQLVYNKQITINNDRASLYIQDAELSSGMYILSIENNQENSSYKLIKK